MTISHMTISQAAEILCDYYNNPDYVSFYADPRHELFNLGLTTEYASSCSWHDIYDDFANWEEYRQWVLYSRLGRKSLTKKPN